MRVSVYFYSERDAREGWILIDIRGLKLAFGEKNIFRGRSCRIADDARMGLVGSNGAGKTTLLRVLMGEIEPDDGMIERSRGLSAGYLPQDLVVKFNDASSGYVEAERIVSAGSDGTVSFDTAGDGEQQEVEAFGVTSADHAGRLGLLRLKELRSRSRSDARRLS